MSAMLVSENPYSSMSCIFSHVARRWMGPETQKQIRNCHNTKLSLPSLMHPVWHPGRARGPADISFIRLMPKYS